jgi:hypothetical protein
LLQGQLAPAKPAPAPAVKTPRRIVAVGDLHGDLAAARAALQLAGAVDGRDRWQGGGLVIVQTGDLLDRGDDDIALIEYLNRQDQAARAHGGRVIVLNGNHELMNVDGDLRYVTPGGFLACRERFFALASGAPRDPLDRAPRALAFAPGGPLARRLAQHDLAVVLGDTVFVHGGLLPWHVRYGVDRLNHEQSAWMRGERPAPENVLHGDDSPVWFRGYSSGEPSVEMCGMAREALHALGARRMVVGHSQQKRINSACDATVWRIDVGMARAFGGPVEVLEITPGHVRPVSRTQGPPRRAARAP